MLAAHPEKLTMRIITLALLLAATSLSSSGVLAADVANRPTLTLDGAKAVASVAIRYAREHQAPGAAVAIVDSGGTLLYVERLDETFQNAANISIGKARTAVLFGKPTRVFEDLVNKGRFTMLALPEIAAFTPLMGGVPIEFDGHVIGAIGVSGASSAAQDDEIATAAAAEFLKNQLHRTSQVTVIPRATVEAGFATDATLVNDADFRVNASHRAGPGEAEVHAKDTDIFYVLRGRAELIVGGKVSDPRSLSAEEIRGSKIEGGEVRTIAQGDVITIPRGIPHWFKQVSTPFTYYVIKSTHNG
jgi:glc operon protein GlcG